MAEISHGILVHGKSTIDLATFSFYSVHRNPNGEGLPHWPEYDQKEGYLKIGVPTQEAHRLKDKEVAFWTELRANEAAERSTQSKHVEL